MVSVEEALAVHEASLSLFGGRGGVRDIGVLESALAQPFQSFGGEDLYPDDLGKAARLCYGVVADHPFVDGNKRTGAALLGAFLRTSGYLFKPEPDDLYATVMAVASGAMDGVALERWVRENAGPRDR